MWLRHWQIALTSALILSAPASVFAQRPGNTNNNTSTYGQAARILTNQAASTPGTFVNPTYRTPSGAYDANVYGWRNTFPSALIPTPPFRPMAGAGDSEPSIRLNPPGDDDDLVRPFLPGSGGSAAPVFQPRPGDDLMASTPSITPASTKATVVVHVPVTAQVWFGDVLMRTAGSERSYDTPTLSAGETYQYVIKARWLQDGRTIEKSQEVIVRAGERSLVNFGESAGP